MSKALLAGVMLLVASTSLNAQPPSDKWLVGVWELSPDSKERFTPECRGMLLEFTADGRVIRTTGDLVYTTKVEITPTENRYRLVEELTSQNGARACSGKEAEIVLKHLKANAYVRPEGEHLLYYKSESEISFMTFSRAGA